MMLNIKPRLHRHCDCDAAASQPKKKRQLQRGCKGLRKILLKSPQHRYNDATRFPVSHGTKSVVSCLLSMHKNWPRLIWSLIGFIGLREVFFLIPEWFPTLWRSVLSKQEWELFQGWLISDEAVIDQHFVADDRLQLVAKWFPSVHRLFAVGFAVCHRPVCACHKNSKRTLTVAFFRSRVSTSTSFAFFSIACTSSQQKWQFVD